MDNRCHNCGYGNETYASKCAKCGTSFEEDLSMMKKSIKYIRTFSIIYLASSAIGTGEFIYQYIWYGQFSYGIFSAASTFNPQQIQNLVTSLLYAVVIIAVITSVLTLASVFYLRKGYRGLTANDKDFSSPVTGTTLVIIGMIIIVVSLPIMLALALVFLPGLVQSAPIFSSSSFMGLIVLLLLVVVGVIILLVGVILSILLGIHKLALKFDESMFETSWILYLVSFFFSPLGLVASYLSYAGSNRSIRRLEDSMAMPV